MATATKLDIKKNFAIATTTTALGVGDTSWVLTAGQGANLPSTANGSYDAVIWDQTNSPDNPFRSAAGFEFVTVNTLATDNITDMDRAQQGTSAIALSGGPSFAIAAVPSELDWDNVRKMIQEQASNYAVATGTGDIIAITLDPAPVAYVDGAYYKFRPIANNTVAIPTLNVNGLGPINILSSALTVLFAKQIKISVPVTVQYIELSNLFVLSSAWLSVPDMYNNAFDFGSTTGATNTYNFSYIIDPISANAGDFQPGSVVRFKAHDTNTGASTFTVLTFTGDIVKQNGASLEAGDIVTDDMVTLVKVGSGGNGDWQLMSAGVRTGSDINAKVTTNDTTTGFLDGKIAEGLGIDTTVLSPGGNETLEIKVDEAALDLANLGGTLPIASGGTGQTDQTEGFDALAPTTTAGDTSYHDGSDNVRLAIGSAIQIKQVNSAGDTPEWADDLHMLSFNHNNGGAVVVQGNKATFKWPWDAEVVAFSLLADVSGTVDLDIRQTTQGSYTGYATTGTSIVGSEIPSLSGAVKTEDTDTTTWTDPNKDDIWIFEIDTTATPLTITAFDLHILVKRTS